MQTTTNIGLKTYEAGDPTDWLGEFNYNMNKIDENVGTQNQSINLIGQTATTAVNTANTASATASEALQTAGTKASIDDNVASASTTYSSNKINTEVSAKASINDTVTSTSRTWSSSKIKSVLTPDTELVSFTNITSILTTGSGSIPIDGSVHNNALFYIVELNSNYIFMIPADDFRVNQFILPGDVIIQLERKSSTLDINKVSGTLSGNYFLEVRVSTI